jgi:hypothetical protein
MDVALRFDTFVVGASNRLAASAARAVAEAPGQSYNPLVVHGGSGRGKTHLMAAIAQRSRELQGDLRVLVSSGEEVAEHLHRTVTTGRHHEFLLPYESVGLLVLDDVQCLTGTRETQSELLRLLNLLLQRGRQLVLTCDRPPLEIADVDERLLSRLSGGLVVDVGRPDFEMRLEILRNVASSRIVAFAPGVLEEVARLPFANVRELKGAFNRLTAFQQLDAQPVFARDVRAIVGAVRGEPRVDQRRPHAPTAPSTPLEPFLPAVRIDATLKANADDEGFIADVMYEVESRVEPWRVRLGEAVAHWTAHGYAVGVLERAMTHPEAPDVHGLLDLFAKAIEHLGRLEAQAVTADPTLRGHPAFRDPASITQARLLAQQAIATASPLPAPSDQLALSDALHAQSGGGRVVGRQRPARPDRARLEMLVTRAPGEVDRLFEDREKSIWNWPDVGGRLIEEYR